MPNWRSRIRRRAYNMLPVWFRNNAFKIFASVLCLVGGVPLVLGEINPRSMEATLPVWVVMPWAVVLTFAPILIMVSIWQRHKVPAADSLFWFRTEAIGLTALAYSSYVYSVAILGFQGPVGWPAAMLIIAFGLTCHTEELKVHVNIQEFLTGLGIDERSRE